MATTSLISVGSIFFNMLSIPCFKVKVEEGQPLQAPCNKTETFPSSKEINFILPPSDSTAGATYSSSMSTMRVSISFNYAGSTCSKDSVTAPSDSV